MSETLNIQSALSYARGILFGTKSSDSTKGETVDVTNGALHAFLASLLAGENPSLNVLETINGGNEYVTGAFVTSNTAVTLGSTGAAGDVLDTVWVFNGSASPFTAFTISDGSVVLDFLNPGMATLAAGSYGVYQIPGGPLKSKNGGWKITATCIGTMASIKYGAKGLFF